MLPEARHILAERHAKHRAALPIEWYTPIRIGATSICFRLAFNRQGRRIDQRLAWANREGT